MPVTVDVPIHDMPGPSRFKVRCDACGDMVRDKKEVRLNDRVLCRSCAYGTFYQPRNQDPYDDHLMAAKAVKR
jgi:formylmethanofuran dehydrogenase subunit E